MSVVPITSEDLKSSEVAWFSALCSDDYQFLGVPDGSLRSNWEKCLMPIILSSRPRHTFVCSGLRINNKKHQSASCSAMWRNAADYAW